MRKISAENQTDKILTDNIKNAILNLAILH